MDKEKLITPVILIALGIAFIYACFMVAVRKDNKAAISRKLKIGAAIISLTAFINTGSYAQKTCYKPAIVEKPNVFITNSGNENNVRTISNGGTLLGNLNNYNSDSKYHVTICDTTGKIIDKNQMEIDSLNTWSISFENRTPGKYILKFYEAGSGKSEDELIYETYIKVYDRRDERYNTCYF
ncbi:MAG: hypothetical protein A2W91_17715 [Bacteroidetes bacterium GWF2_38_335]|nr:MAG: hypothetical protein A2W91_17715 [Bacteroidetes bacterium GWF2_38_335]OFY78028.1 MAG: hypothetical protein A2281_18745 [Bacteroidetes bacterium RIFOXYA12_FULL_38_20]HBS88300.1 hypothetical protein [Bacteroidales bacterium]